MYLVKSQIQKREGLGLSVAYMVYKTSLINYGPTNKHITLENGIFTQEEYQIRDQVDIDQMLDIASNSKTHCPEPILLILSGANNSRSISLGLFVFLNEPIYVLRKQ